MEKIMTSLTRLSPQSENPDFYGIPKFFGDHMKNAEPENNVSVENKTKVEEPTIEMPYTYLELQFILFAKEIFRPVSDEKNLVSLGSTNNNQALFNKYIEKGDHTIKFDLKDQRVDLLISSIWTKSRNNVLHKLNEWGTATKVADENECLKKAAAQEIVNSAQNNPERIFTHRQAGSLFQKAQQQENQLARHSKL